EWTSACFLAARWFGRIWLQRPGSHSNRRSPVNSGPVVWNKTAISFQPSIVRTAWTSPRAPASTAIGPNKLPAPNGTGEAGLPQALHRCAMPSAAARARGDPARHGSDGSVAVDGWCFRARDVDGDHHRRPAGWPEDPDVVAGAVTASSGLAAHAPISRQPGPQALAIGLAGF